MLRAGQQWGKLNEGVRFNGSTSYIDFGNPSSLPSGSNPRTVCAWINPANGGPSTQVIFSYGTATTNNLFGMSRIGTDLVGYGRNNNVTATGVLPSGTWTHACLKYDGVTATLYTNGKTAATLATTAWNTILSKFYVGTQIDGSSEYWNGTIDEIALWSTTLSDAEIQTLYSRQSPSYAGTFTSRIIDAGSAQTWTNLSWISTFPSLKELPVSPTGESSSYSSLTGTSLMSGNIALWRLNESAGTTGTNSVRDQSNSGLHGTPTSVTFGGTGRFGNAPTFDGSSSYIDLGAPAALNMGTNNWSTQGWFKTTATNGYIIAKSLYGAQGGRWAMGFSSSNGKILAFMAPNTSAGPTAESPLSYNDGQWHHAVAVFNRSGNLILYVDGVNVASTSIAAYSDVDMSTGNKALIGAYNNASGTTPPQAGFYFNGQLDEVGVWNRALSPSEVSALYRRGANRLKIQVRSCATSTCSAGTEPWKGFDNSTATYFSELNNNTNVYGTGAVQTSQPNLYFPNFSTAPLVISKAQYFQYRAIFESDDNATSPEVKSVSVAGPTAQTISNHTDKIDANLGTAEGASLNNTTIDSTTGFLRLATGQTSGTYISRIFDAVSDQAWTNLSWITSLPYMKELPDRGSSESQSNYTALADSSLMSGNVALWHLNEPAGSTSYSDSSGNGFTGTSALSTISGQPGRLGNGITLSANDSITVAHHDSLNAFPITIASWFKHTSNASWPGIVNKYSGGSSNGYQILQTATGVHAWYFKNASNYVYNGNGPTNTTNDGNWHLATFVVDATGGYLYIDGALSTSIGWVGTPGAPSTTQPLSFGYYNGGSPSTNFSGSIDEVGIWNRALSATEVQQLYRRGANRVKFQVRSCATSACSNPNETWEGYDNTTSTFFSELNNNSNVYGTGNTLAGLPNLYFPNFTAAPLTIPKNRYFQYKATLETDNVAYSPDIKSVSIKSVSPNVSTGGLPTSAPTITNTAPVTLSSLSSLSQILGASGCTGTPKFLLSTNGSTWYGWNGFTWTSVGSGSYAFANTEAEINGNLNTFASSLSLSGNFSLYIRVYLNSNGFDPCQLTGLTITGGVSAAPAQGATPVSLSWNPPPLNPASANSLMQPFKVQVLDAAGYVMTALNSASGAISHVTLSVTQGTGTLSGTLTQPVVAGIATFNDITYPTAEPITILATLSNPTLTLSRSLTIVAQGEFSLSRSQITSPASTPVGTTATLTLTLRDANGLLQPTGAHSVSFYLASATGGAAGTFGSVVNSAVGVYTVPFTATAPGVVSFGATVHSLMRGGTVTSAPSPAAMIIYTSAPTLSGVPNHKIFLLGSSSPPVQQASYISSASGVISLTGVVSATGIATPTGFTISSTGSAPGTLTMSCTYSTMGLSNQDPNFANGNDCNSLASLGPASAPYLVTSATGVSGVFNATNGSGVASGVFRWAPTYKQRGTYAFTFKSTDSNSMASNQNLYISVVDPYTTANLLGVYDPLFAGVGPAGAVSSIPAEPLLTENGTNSTNSNFLTGIGTTQGDLSRFGSWAPFLGTGRSSASSVDPYALAFSGTNFDSMNLGTLMNGSTKFAVQAWIKPSAPTAPGTVLVSNGGSTGNGFEIRQSATPTGRVEFVVGQSGYMNYRDLILGDSPVAYYRLGENSGTTATDQTANANNGTYKGAITLAQAGGIGRDADTGSLFDGVSSYVNIPDSASLTVTGDASLEAWVNFQGSVLNSTIATIGSDYPNFGWGALIGISSTYPSFAVVTGGTQYTVTSSVSLVANTWYHLVGTRSGASIRIYVNGIMTQGTAVAGSLRHGSTSPSQIGAIINSSGTTGSFTRAIFDEVAIYNSALTPTQVIKHYNGAYGNAANAILTDAPGGYWRLGERSGTTGYDYSGRGNNGTYGGGYTLAKPGKLTAESDTAVLFNGSTGQLDLGAPSNLLFDRLTPFSTEAWVKLTDNGSTQTIVSKELGSGAFTGWGVILDPSYAYLQLINNYPSNVMEARTPLVNFYNGGWHHIVTTYDGSGTFGGIAIYIDGVSQTLTATYNSLSGSFLSSANLAIGARSSLWGANGTVDEVALYNYVLSPTQVTSHYNSGNGAPWWTCMSNTVLNSANWNLLEGIYDGTTAQLFMNGRLECSVTPGTTYTSTVATTTVGSTPSRLNFWSGLLGFLDIFGTTSGTVASATTAKADFDATANRFRTTPVENIVGNGLILSFDAANASQGTAPYSFGCSGAPFNLVSGFSDGTLFGFSSCGTSSLATNTSGWHGNGITTPYQIDFTGATNNAYVDFGRGPDLTLTGITVEVWFNTLGNSNTQNAALLGKWHNGGLSDNSFTLVLGQDMATNRGGFAIEQSNLTVLHLKPPTANMNFAANTWNHLVGVADGNGYLHLYLNGTDSGQTTAYDNTINWAAVNTILGRLDTFDTNYPFAGAIPIGRIYNRGLTSQEVKQNCAAQQARFSSSAICAP